jgi:type IV pilus assembly protein PilA
MVVGFALAMREEKPLPSQQSKIMNLSSLKKALGFTLVELLAVVAILTVLVAVALPAYNNYAVKSKFAEVVLATAPTKTAISTCAASGDCVSGVGSAAQVYLGAPSVTTCSSSVQNVCTTTPPYSCSNRSGQAPCCNGGTFAGTVSQTNFYNCPAVTNCANQTVQTCQAISSLVSIPCVGAAGCSPATKYAASVSYDQNGVITATAISGSQGLAGEQFVLSPSYQDGRVDWIESGSCQTRAGGALC